MPVLDFREIPASNVASGDQDKFELFARDLLRLEGYKIVSGPDRGPDGGRDLIARETRLGPGGATHIRWLVSCKHNAHSGRSVRLGDEQDVGDRLNTNECQGFLGVYSTLPATPLTNKLEALTKSKGIELQLLDGEAIERKLLACGDGLTLARRYFPSSIAKWAREHPGRVSLFSDSEGLSCEYCGRALLTAETSQQDLMTSNSGIIVAWHARGGPFAR
jgi:hypothetical protein